VIPPGSRYEEAAREFVACHIYNEYGYVLIEEDQKHFRRRIESREATYLVTALPLPPPPPQEYYAKDTESFQFIAYKFLKNPLLWWEVAEANPQIWYPLDLTMGSYIHVPT
jgi:hypothetical protein